MTKCPLEKTWCEDFCSLLDEHNKNNTHHACPHQYECGKLKELLMDTNMSTTVTKRILTMGIPNAL